jgi:hypothetical protein
VGAFGWGLGCDIIGRQWAFNITLCITGVFGMIAASAPNFGAIATFAALWSIGVGGNLFIYMCSKLTLDLLIRRSSWNSFLEVINGF